MGFVISGYLYVAWWSHKIKGVASKWFHLSSPITLTKVVASGLEFLDPKPAGEHTAAEEEEAEAYAAWENWIVE